MVGGGGLLINILPGISAGNPYRFIDDEALRGGNWTWPLNITSSGRMCLEEQLQSAFVIWSSFGLWCDF